MHDYLKTIFLLGILSVFVILIGGVIGGQDGLYFAFFFALIMNGLAFFFSDKLALMGSGAKPLDQNEGKEIYSIIRNLTTRMKLPMPKLYKIPSAQANAFATGRDPNHSSVAVTEGLMKILDKSEIEGVLAHELGHIKNRDILVASVAAVLASVVTFMSRMPLFGGSDEDRPAGGLALLLAIFAPIAAMLIQLAISRNREFEADETGAETMHTGKHLASALLKIHDSTKKAPLNTNPAFSSLYIDNPIGGFGGSMLKLFSTHPPVEERVKKLTALEGKV